MSCLLLEDGLPETIDGVAIYPDFRNMIRFEQIMDDDALNDMTKVLLGVQQLFDALPPGGIERAVDRLKWFYSRGKYPDHKTSNQAGEKAVQVYDLIYDAPCIFAAFWQAYQIDLTGISYLHWWSFLSLLENLPEDTAMAQRMQLRAMNLSEIKDKKMRERYKALQTQLALPQKAAARNQHVETMAERVNRRYAEAQAELERRRLHGI